MKAKSIERIAEELGVNFYNLYPLIKARDEFHFKAGMQKVVDFLTDTNLCEHNIARRKCGICWQAFLKENGLEGG